MACIKPDGIAEKSEEESSDDVVDAAEVADIGGGQELTNEIVDAGINLPESLKSQEATYILKLECPVCKSLMEKPVDAFVELVREHGPIRCYTCPGFPEMMVTNYNAEAIKVAGFRYEQQRQGHPGLHDEYNGGIGGKGVQADKGQAGQSGRDGAVAGGGNSWEEGVLKMPPKFQSGMRILPTFSAGLLSRASYSLRSLGWYLVWGSSTFKFF